MASMVVGRTRRQWLVERNGPVPAPNPAGVGRIASGPVFVTTGDRPAMHVQITTAAGSKDEADAIAMALVGARLAACVQVLGPMRSTYRWKGGVESAEEWLCLVKSTTVRAEEAMAEIARVHSYETPEITVTPIVDGAPSYLAWIDAEVALQEGM